MQALRILMLVVVLALAYLLVLRPTMKTDALPPELADPSAAVTTAPGSHAVQAPRQAHSQYKEDMDRAHAAAKQMQAQRAEADSF